MVIVTIWSFRRNLANGDNIFEEEVVSLENKTFQ